MHSFTGSTLESIFSQAIGEYIFRSRVQLLRRMLAKKAPARKELSMPIENMSRCYPR